MWGFATSVKIKVSAILFLDVNSIRFLGVVSALPLYHSIVRKFIVGECKDIYNRLLNNVHISLLDFLMEDLSNRHLWKPYFTIPIENISFSFLLLLVLSMFLDYIMILYPSSMGLNSLNQTVMNARMIRYCLVSFSVKISKLQT